MKKLFSTILVLSLLVSNIAQAKKNKRTWDYPFSYYGKYRVEGSKDFYNFNKIVLDVFK